MKFLSSILLFMASALTICAQTPDSVATVASLDTLNQVADQLPVPAEEQPVAGLSGENLAQQADSAYTADNFVLAEALYLKALEVGGSSTTLYYNLGNAYYRQGNLGKAIVNYERALKLDPTNADARANLEFVNSKITDKQIDSGSYMDSVWEGTVGMFHADTWAVIALVLFAIFLGALGRLYLLIGGSCKESQLFRRADSLHPDRLRRDNLFRGGQPGKFRQVCHHTSPIISAFHVATRGAEPVGTGVPPSRGHQGRDYRLDCKSRGRDVV